MTGHHGKNRGGIIAAALASCMNVLSTNHPLQETSSHPTMVLRSNRKGHFKQGKKCRAREPKKYIPAGPRCNVRGNYPKNKKQNEQTNAMHDAWYKKKFG